jgi:hypothetical protein
MRCRAATSEIIEEKYIIYERDDSNKIARKLGLPRFQLGFLYDA